jgi:PAS domain S-box-containing protein
MKSDSFDGNCLQKGVAHRAVNFVDDHVILKVVLILILANAVFFLPNAHSAALDHLNQKPIVLVIQSYHFGFSWTDNISRGILSAFAEFQDRIELRFEFLDARRINSDLYFDALEKIFLIKYARHEISVLICADDQALDFAIRLRKSIFADVPIAFCSVSRAPSDEQLQQNMTGLRESLEIKASLDIALRLHPQTRRIAVITDMTKTGQALKKKAQNVFRPYAGGLAFQYWENFTVDELYQQAARLDEDTIVFLFIFSQDKAGRVLSHEQNLRNLMKYCRRPIYSVWKFYLKHGIVGGKLTSGEAEGRLIGEIALQILNGANASDIPMRSSPSRYMFDHQQLVNFALTKEMLPANSLIVNQPFDFYQSYKHIIWITTAIFSIMLALILVLIINILRRRQAEVMLKKFSLIVSASQDLMALVDDEFTYQAANESYLKAFGKSEAQLVGQRVVDIIGEELFHHVLKEKMNQCFLGKEVHFQGWFSYPASDSKYMDVKYSPYADQDGKITALVINSRDITETKQMENQLIQSQKMEAIGTLAGGIAHDFNNLLLGISGRTSLMLLESDISLAAREQLKEIERYVERATQLTKQILGFARGGKYEVKATNLNRLIQEQNRMFGRTKREIRIIENLEKSLWNTDIDRAQIEQALLNLYINAWHAMPSGGALYIQSENIVVDEPFEKPYQVKSGRYVKFSVTDTGDGMDEETCKRVFEPFFTTKNMGSGTGLGLASVYGIIKNHGGFINVYSQLGKGTTFSVYLPASSKEVVAESKSAYQISTGKGTVLLVDDEELVLDVGGKMIERLGYRVIPASGGIEAVDLFREHRAKIDAVVLDMIMPDMSGSDTYQRLKEIAPDIRVLLASGYSLDGTASEILQQGCNGFIQKPFNLHQLSQKLKDVMATD